MSIAESPKSQEQIESEVSKEEEIATQINACFEIIDQIVKSYEANNSLIITLNNITGSQARANGPWKNDSSENTRTIFNYLTYGPIQNLVDKEISTNNQNKLIKNYATETGRVEKIKVFLTNALSNLEKADIAKYQQDINEAKATADSALYSLTQERDYHLFINNEISNPNSKIYKGPSETYGPFSNEEIYAFALPEEIRQMAANNLLDINRFNTIITTLDKIINTPEDVLNRVGLGNIGLTQNSEDPNILNTETIVEKDPWGIRFSYNKIVSGSTYIDNINTANNARANRTLTHDNQTREENKFIQTPKDIASKTVVEQRNFYFQLLPAIKSNLPVSASTDAPGAMPGIQFRIENNIVKHRIPGFAPIYQPIGIDSIKCTLVGMFTGNDGVDLSSTFSSDLNTGLLLPNKNAQFGTRDLTNKYNDGTSTPIPSESKSSTSSDIAILSEDAFQGAQDFYNEIVSTGQEIEVELNLRKGTLDYPGGTPGPFRDEITGNPKFKALIKKLDLYYVRRDRCWFIIDLEITNSGLIGTKCINLTNTIEEAVDLFEAIPDEAVGLTKAELDKCFTAPLIFPYINENSGYILVVDQNSGLSYEYKKDTNTLRSSETYPTPPQQTLEKLRKEAANFNYSGLNGTLGNKKKRLLKEIIYIMSSSVESVKTNKQNSDFKWSPNRLVLQQATQNRYYAYNENDGLFYIQDKKSNLVDQNSEKNKVTLEQIKNRKLELIEQDASFGQAEVDEALRFFLDDNLPLVTFKKVDCITKLEDKKNNSNNITATTNTTPEVIDIESVKEEANTGSYNSIIQEALTDASALMQSKQLNTETYLSNTLQNVISKDAANKKIYITEAKEGFNIILKEGSVKLEQNKSNDKVIYLKYKYNVSADALLIINNKKYYLYKNAFTGNTSVNKEGIIKLIKEGNGYKINALSLQPV